MPLDLVVGLHQVDIIIPLHLRLIIMLKYPMAYCRQVFKAILGKNTTLELHLDLDILNDINPATAIDRDQSLIGGAVHVQMASTGDASTATWTNIGNAVVIHGKCNGWFCKYKY